ncbi:MAG: hypothetical protein H0X63_06750 [Flavobacteriales bacterium]|nr:hypothetical protein [Flavobacteriales bacterium]
MGSLTISNKISEKYFGYLKNLDNKAKMTLIDKLTKSLDKKSKNEFDLTSLFGAWEDTKNSKEIIAEIKNSRVNKINTETF